MAETLIIHDAFGGAAADISGRMPDTVNNGNSWVEVAGDSDTNGSGALVVGTAPTTNPYQVSRIQTGYRDYTVELILQDHTETYGGIIFRDNGTTHYLFSKATNNRTAQLRYWGGSSYTEIDSRSVSGTATNPATMKIVVLSTNVTCYVNDAQPFSIDSIDAGTSRTYVGKRAGTTNSKFNDFKVWADVPGAGSGAGTGGFPIVGNTLRKGLRVIG